MKWTIFMNAAVRLCFVCYVTFNRNTNLTVDSVLSKNKANRVKTANKKCELSFSNVNNRIVVKNSLKGFVANVLPAVYEQIDVSLRDFRSLKIAKFNN